MREYPYTHADLFQFFILSMDEAEAKFRQLKMGVGRSMGGAITMYVL